MRLAAAALFVFWTLTTSAQTFPWDARHEAPHPVRMEIRRFAPAIGILTVPLAVLAAENVDDKLAHCIAGAGISTAVGLTFQPVDGWIVAVGAGYLKERADRKGGGVFDYEDLATTTACGAVPYLLMEHLRP